MNYEQSWEAMNNLEMCISKVCSAREILDCAIDKMAEQDRTKAENLMYAADEFLQMFIKEFDEKFKVAWKEVIVNQKEENLNLQYGIKPSDPEEQRPEYLSYQGAVEAGWTMTDDDHWIPPKKNKTKNWVLPVEADPSGEYFLTFPDDLLEAADLKEGDEIEWVDNGDGVYVFKKATTSETGTTTTPRPSTIP
jgi:hypothetical protein